MSATLSDQDLVHQAKQGNLEAFEELTNRYERQIYSLARRMVGQEHDAEDVTQTTFISALQNLNNFREEASFSTWIHRIATFAALKVLRKRKGLDTISLDQAVEPQETTDNVPRPDFIADWTTNPEALASRNETRSAIEQALSELDEKHRLVFLLRDVEGFSVRETAESLGISEGNVKVRLLRARLQLRERLTRIFGDPQQTVSRSHSHPHKPATPSTAT